MRWSLAALLLAACTTPVGQKVKVLIEDDEVTCFRPADSEQRIAVYELDQPEDYYIAELVEQGSEVFYSLPAERVGTTVTFRCPESLESFTVRHATVLATVVADSTDVREAP